MGIKGGVSIFIEAIRSFSVNSGFNQAASLSFFSILSLIPFVFLIFSISGFLTGWIQGGPDKVLSFIEDSFPYLKDLIHKEIILLIKKKKVFGYIGLLTLLWSATLIFSSLERSFQNIFRSDKRRSYLYSKLLSLLIMPLGLVVFMFSFTSSVMVQWMGEKAFHLLGIRGIFSIFKDVVFVYLIPIAFLSLFFTIIYRVIPQVRISMRQAFVTGLICAMFVILADTIFAWYVKRAAKYSIIYGSMSAFIIFLLWYYYISIIILLCGELLSAYIKRDHLLLKKAFK
jgi:membrane protein